MSRPHSGGIVVKHLADGTRVFKLRFHVHGRREVEVLHERRECNCGCGGGWNERTAAVELENILSRVRAGIWRKRRVELPPVADGQIPTFHEYASQWLQAKVDGVLGDRPIAPATEADYRSRLANHLLPFFGKHRLNEIDAPLCLSFKAYKIRESEELKRAIAAGADLRDRQRRRMRPLAPASIHMLTSCLKAILDEAVDDGHIDRNPARSRRMRVKVPKPTRTFLEMDELVALCDAAGEQDARRARLRTYAKPSRSSTAAKVAERWLAGTPPSVIANELGRAKSTIHWHLRQLAADGPAAYVSRRAIVATLGGSGIRVSELCNARIRDLRLHGSTGAHLQIPDSKTEAGIREVQVSPDLHEELVTHLHRLQSAGLSTEPDAPLFPNTKGDALKRNRASQIVREAASVASARLIERGLPELPNTTPHTLRRTYVSVALLANKFDVLWVMRQVGHANSKMTMDVYAQMQQRAERQHGEAFDGLVRQARERLNGATRNAAARSEQRPSSRVK
jgi:integrase